MHDHFYADQVKAPDPFPPAPYPEVPDTYLFLSVGVVLPPHRPDLKPHAVKLISFNPNPIMSLWPFDLVNVLENLVTESL